MSIIELFDVLYFTLAHLAAYIIDTLHLGSIVRHMANG